MSSKWNNIVKQLKKKPTWEYRLASHNWFGITSYEALKSSQFAEYFLEFSSGFFPIGDVASGSLMEKYLKKGSQG